MRLRKKSDAEWSFPATKSFGLAAQAAYIGLVGSLSHRPGDLNRAVRVDREETPRVGAVGVSRMGGPSVPDTPWGDRSETQTSGRWHEFSYDLHMRW